MANQREASKKNWLSKDTLEDINSGSLQRIADACEKMSDSVSRLIADARMWENSYNRMRIKNLELKRELRILKRK